MAADTVCRRLVSRSRETWRWTRARGDSVAWHGLGPDGGRTDTQRARTEPRIGTAETRCDLTGTPDSPFAYCGALSTAPGSRCNAPRRRHRSHSTSHNPLPLC